MALLNCYSNDKLSDGCVSANSADPDQTVCNIAITLYPHFSMIEHFYSKVIIRAKFWGVLKFGVSKIKGLYITS